MQAGSILVSMEQFEINREFGKMMNGQEASIMTEFPPEVYEAAFDGELRHAVLEHRRAEKLYTHAMAHADATTDIDGLKHQLGLAEAQYGEVVNTMIYRYDLKSVYDAVSAVSLCAGSLEERVNPQNPHKPT
jgi:hypothetical protein